MHKCNGLMDYGVCLLDPSMSRLFEIYPICVRLASRSYVEFHVLIWIAVVKMIYSASKNWVRSLERLA